TDEVRDEHGPGDSASFASRNGSFSPDGLRSLVQSRVNGRRCAVERRESMKVRTQLEALARRGAGRAASLRVRAIAVSAVLSGLAAPPGAADAAGAHVVEEIVVTASVTETPRRQIGTAVSVISGPEIELRGYHSLADVLRTQP